MKKKIFILLCIFISAQALAWNSRGHMLIASLAYNQLNSSTIEKVTALLKYHPNYKKYWSKEYKKVKGKMEEGEFLMMKASVWPDEIGDSESPNFKYHHSNWHYINHIVNFEEGHDTLIVDGNISPNAVWASEYSKKMVENESLDKTTRAVYLSWLIHIIGDMHNPQHSTSLYSSSYPEGDKGGNRFFVKSDTLVRSLHGLWDSALGSGGIEDLEDFNGQLARISSKHSQPTAQFDVSTFRPLSWSIESFQHSINDAYLKGALREGTSIDEAQPLPDNYIRNMANTCEERSLLAGLRLGNTLTGIVKTSNSNTQLDSLFFNFNGKAKYKKHKFVGETLNFDQGIEGQALSINPNNGFSSLKLEGTSLNGENSFTVQFWLKTTSDKPTVLLSQKEFLNKGISSQRNAGWAFYSSGGTFAWCIGSGKQRLNYERDNGELMPLNDGQWHQLTMTYDKTLSEIRLYYDGQNKAVYNVGFDFDNSNPLLIGASGSNFNYETDILTSIKDGEKLLQNMVDQFNSLDVENLNESEFLSLIVNPKKLYEQKLGPEKSKQEISESTKEILDELRKIKRRLASNPYTVHQNKKLTPLKPISKLYTMRDGKVSLSNYYAKVYTENERLYLADFSLDNLSIWQRSLTQDEVLYAYKKFRNIEVLEEQKRLDTLVVASWNIWHGGIHHNILDHDWDSRLRIAEMFEKNNVDIILMQETYSSGDFIAAELGYYFATTSDADYCDQGSNISVLSRYPIIDIEVPPGAEFMNVAVKLKLSENQEIYAMSNWYGMSSFPAVFDYHKERFERSDLVPILFGGDFNAIPNTDGGNSPASKKMLNFGFIDAYRSLHPDIKTFPGFTHEWADRIDQVYYKGKGLRNISTDVIHSWFGGFPSDHHMIISKFVLEY